jgi:MFS family permease
MVTRFLLGTTEAGFGPGALWYLSTWYTKKETAKRVMVFYFGILFGQACSKLIAFGILHMRGVADRPGWFWLFVLMGSYTCVNGIVFGFLLPDFSRNPHSAFLPRVSLFSKRQMHILKTRVLLDDPMKGQKKKRIGLVSFKKLVRIFPT